MKKKMCVIVLILVFPLPIWAKFLPFCGYYAQVNIGGVQPQLKNSRSDQILTPTRALQFQSQPTLTDSAYSYGIAFGFAGVLQNQTRTSIEFRGQFQDPDMMHSTFMADSTTLLNVNLESRVKYKDAYSVILRTGGLLSRNTLLYGFVGPEVTTLKLTSSINYQQMPVPGVQNQSMTTRQADKNRWGVVCGAGIQQMLNSNFSLGFEYQYRNFKSFEYEDLIMPAVFQNGAVLASSSLSETLRVKLSAQTALLTLAYYYR